MTDQTPPIPSPGDSGAGPAYPSQVPTGQPSYGNPYGYGSPYQQPIQLPPSTAMATWALVLAFIPCLFSFVASIPMAIVVLVRCRDGRNHGKKRAIAALVIAGLWLLGGVVFVALAFFGVVSVDNVERDETGHVSKTSVASAFSLKVGDCFDQGVDLPELGGGDTEQINQVTIKPCTELHLNEVFATFELPDGDYPDQATMLAGVKHRCYPEILPYAGHADALRTTAVYYIYPLKTDWSLRHRHTVTCFFTTKSPTSSSLKKD